MSSIVHKLSNNRLKLTARRRSVGAWRLRARRSLAGALGGREDSCVGSQLKHRNLSPTPPHNTTVRSRT